MILVDTSVWIDHFRKSEAILVRLLMDGQVLSHPYVTGELALGNLKQRKRILDALAGLPAAIAATYADVLGFIESNSLFGKGIGYIDAHLLAATRLNPGVQLWTRDKRLAEACSRMNPALLFAAFS